MYSLCSSLLQIVEIKHTIIYLYIYNLCSAYVFFFYIEKYFDMNKKQCRDALDLYKKFLIRMDRVGEFLKVAENVGIDKGEIPDLTKVYPIKII